MNAVGVERKPDRLLAVDFPGTIRVDAWFDSASRCSIHVNGSAREGP